MVFHASFQSLAASRKGPSSAAGTYFVELDSKFVTHATSHSYDSLTNKMVKNNQCQNKIPHPEIPNVSKMS